MHPCRPSQHRLLIPSVLGQWPWASLGPVLAKLCILGLALWATVGLAQAHTPSSGPVSRPHPHAESLTQDLMTLGMRHQLADTAIKSRLLRQLLTAATERQALLAAIIQDNPREVLRLTLPADLRASLPPAVQALVEEEMEVEGEHEVLHEDRDVGSRFVYFLKTARRRFALHFAAHPPTHLATATRVRVTGVQVGQALALGSSSTSVQTLATALPNTFGAQPTLVILVHCHDKIFR